MADMDNEPPVMNHKEEVSSHLSSMGQRLFRFIEFDNDEVLLAEIRKHPVGLFFILFTGLLISGAILAATSFLSSNLDYLGLDSGDNESLLRTVILALGFVVSSLGLLMTLITVFLYRSNVVFVTDQKIAEVVYISLFNRRILQLGIGNVEDVSVIQRGILPRIFNYGSLVVETAGESENPAFTYVPNPNINSQIIIQAHEEHVKKYGT